MTEYPESDDIGVEHIPTVIQEESDNEQDLSSALASIQRYEPNTFAESQIQREIEIKLKQLLQQYD